MSEPVEPTIEQHVTADGGTAVGVVGAHLKTLDEPTPGHLFTPWPPTEADGAETRDPEAQDAGTPDTNPRDTEARNASTRSAEALADLIRWRDDPVPLLSVRWLSCPDPAHATALANHFARDSATADWLVLAAVPTHPAQRATRHPARHPAQRAAPHPAPRPASVPPAHSDLLVLVERADTRGLDHLGWLLSDAAFHQAGRRARLLLLAPDGDAWPALRGALADEPVRTSWQQLATAPTTALPTAPTTTAHDAG
ncbi:hypothetical protein [Streptacidiphilus cavernicola]|uniref:Uncharacterized protein n=1 Tax=Streptacidiphilus cavernicola TaxID=3342716 RepID=A0ABV6VZF8_9ACTN